MKMIAKKTVSMVVAVSILLTFAWMTTPVAAISSDSFSTAEIAGYENEFTNEVSIIEFEEVNLIEATSSASTLSLRVYLEKGTTQSAYSGTLPSGTISWTSSNTSVATITSTGQVTGVSAGSTVITLKVNNVVQATATLYVALKKGFYTISEQAMVGQPAITLLRKLMTKVQNVL